MTRPALATWVGDVLGPVTVRTDHSRQVGRVVEVVDAEGRPWVVKTVPNDELFRNEVRAYRQWVPHFADQAPRLRSAQPRLRTLILQHVPGRAEWSFKPAVHREAGELLARIHTAAPQRPRSPGLADASADLLDRALRRLPARDLVSDQELAFVTASVDELRCPTGLSSVPCHGDYGGHNWLRGVGPLRVIDFSGSRWDAAASDFARLFIGPWWERPDLWSAFFEGYGRPIGDDELSVVRLQLPALALMVLSHGHRRANPAMARRGHHRLARLMAGRDFTSRAPLVRRVAQGARRLAQPAR